MRKTIRKLLAVILSICMLTGIFVGTNINVNAASYQGTKIKASLLATGDTFEMGMYPQGVVTDKNLIVELNSMTCKMKNYGYIKNSNSETHSYQTINMTYVDLVYKGEAYRKVNIKEYKPTNNKNASSTENTWQGKNGYLIGKTYYFKWEPIVWQVLCKESNGVYVMAKALLDSREYNIFKENTTWENSTLRNWLNNDFYNTAFSEKEKGNINEIIHANENSPINSSVSGGNGTTDHIWIASYNDVTKKSHGFSSDIYDDTGRKTEGSDYAKCQGLNTNYQWLRNPGYYSYYACVVSSDAYGNFDVNVTCVGIRPALKINLEYEISQSDDASLRIEDFLCTHENTILVGNEASTCTTNGYTGDTYCLDCETVLSAGTAIPALSHTLGAPVKEKVFSATCTAGGSYDEVVYCTECGTEISRIPKTTSALGHTLSDEWSYDIQCHWKECMACYMVIGETSTHIFETIKANETTATCTQTGSYDEIKKCAVCGYVLSNTHKTTPATGHTAGDWIIDKKATLTETGLKHKECTVCGETVDTQVIPVIDQNSPQIIVESKKARAGKTVDVNISLKNNPGITSAKIKVNFPAGLTLEDVTFGDIGGMTMMSDSDESPVTLNWFIGNKDLKTSDVVFATLTFKVAEDALIGKKDITVEFDPDDIFDITNKLIDFVAVDGGIEVIKYEPGDITDDGKVNNQDLVLLFQYLSGWDVEVNEAALDINGDGKENNQDLVLLFQYLSGWDVEIF